MANNGLYFRYQNLIFTEDDKGHLTVLDTNSGSDIPVEMLDKEQRLALYQWGRKLTGLATRGSLPLHDAEPST